MKYKLVIFDFDGTLADSFPWFQAVINQVAERYKFKRIEDEEVDTLRGYDARRLMKHLGVPFWKLPLIIRHMKKRMTMDIGRIELFDGVAPLLRELSGRGVALAIVTSNDRANVLRVLGPELAALFQHFECGVSVFGKRAKFKKLIRQSGHRPEEVLCIGDELRDAKAAHEAGVPFGAVAWGYTRLDTLQAQAPAEVFARVDDIRAVVA